MSKREVRTYDKEFKLNAIKLCLDSGRSHRQIADELGIPISTLVEWVQSYTKSGVTAFPGKGHIKASDAELIKLRKELATAREEGDF